METIALLEPTGMVGTKVAKTFQDKQSARKWQNRQYKNVCIRILVGKWKRGQEVPTGTPTVRFS